MEPKTCPIMSRSLISHNMYDREEANFEKVECLQSGCVLWVTLYNTENNSESGCAFAMSVRKNQEGKLIV